MKNYFKFNINIRFLQIIAFSFILHIWKRREERAANERNRKKDGERERKKGNVDCEREIKRYR